MTLSLQNTDSKWFKRLILQTVGLPMASMIIIAIFFSLQIAHLLSNTRWVDHTDRVIALANRIHQRYSYLQSNMRGYILTRDPQYFSGFRITEDQLSGSIQEFRTLVSDNPLQGQRINDAEQILKQYVTFSQNLFRASKSGHMPLTPLFRGKDVYLGNQFNNVIHNIIKSEEDLRDTRLEQVRISTFNTILLGIVLFILFGVAFSLLIQNQLRKLANMYHQAAELIQRSAADQAQKQAELQYQLLINNIKDYAIYFLDPLGTVKSWNKGAEEIEGYRADEIIGKNVSQFHTDEDLQSGKAMLELQQAAATGRYEDEGWRLRKDRTRFWANAIVTPIQNSAGELQGFVKITRDLSLRKKAEEDLKAKSIALSSANTELEAFSYSVSHDLRAPLRGIDGFSQALLEDYGDQLDPIAKDYLHRIRNGVQRMGKLIDDMLNLSRLSRSEMHEEQVELSTLAKQIIQDLVKTQPTRKIDIQIAPNLVVRGDPGLLSAALQNLLSNAWKFTEKKEITKIEFGISNNNGEVIYFIKDNGTGFDMTYSDKLFGAFQRLHKATEFSGSGIGLAIVRRIIHRHGGHIWFQAKEGQGATFYFTLGSKSEIRAA